MDGSAATSGRAWHSINALDIQLSLPTSLVRLDQFCTTGCTTFGEYAPDRVSCSEVISIYRYAIKGGVPLPSWRSDLDAIAVAQGWGDNLVSAPVARPIDCHDGVLATFRFTAPDTPVVNVGALWAGNAADDHILLLYRSTSERGEEFAATISRILSSVSVMKSGVSRSPTEMAGSRASPSRVMTASASAVGTPSSRAIGGMESQRWPGIGSVELGVTLRMPPAFTALRQSSDHFMLGTGLPGPGDFECLDIIRRLQAESEERGIRQTSREWGAMWGEEIGSLMRKERWQQTLTSENPPARVAGYLGRFGTFRYLTHATASPILGSVWTGQIGKDRLAVFYRCSIAREPWMVQRSAAIHESMQFSAAQQPRRFMSLIGRTAR